MCVVYLTVHTSAYIDVMSQLMGFAPGDIEITNRSYQKLEIGAVQVLSIFLFGRGRWPAFNKGGSLEWTGVSHCRKWLFDLKKTVRKMSVIVKVFVLPQPFKNHGESAW